MIESLRLRNVGPAPGMDMELAPRLNLITGDNGLGKSFLLDVIWWALTRRWPQEVNPHMNAGYAARPATPGEDATIGFRARGRSTDGEYEARYVPRDQAWVGSAGRPLLPGLVIYAHTDGSFSFWDPARNYWRRRGDADISERRPAQVFTQDEVWNGASVQENGRRVPICNGLIIDWAAWISAQNESHATMKAVIETLASDGTGVRVEPASPARISIDDPRDIPTIRTGYAEAIPILHASAGIRRVVALAYMLTLAWREHRLAAEQLGEEPCDSVVLLIDEVESHLHPRWQRSILSSLTAAMRELGTPEAVQMKWSSRHTLRWCWPPPRPGSTRNETPGSTWTWRTMRMSYSAVGRMNDGERSATGSRARRSTCSPTAAAWRRSRLSCELGSCSVARILHWTKWKR